MIKLKKLIAIAVLVSMLPGTVMAQGEGKETNAEISEGQNMSTTEVEPNEGNLVDMTATTERETYESAELTDERSRCEENEHSGSEVDPDTEMTYTKENPGMPASKRARKSDEGCEEEMTTAPAHKDAETTKDPVCTATTMVDDEENPDMPASKRARKSDEDGVEKMTTASEQKDAETTKDPVCTATAMVDDEKNSSMSASKNAREPDEDGVEKTTTESDHKENKSSEELVYPKAIWMSEDEVELEEVVGAYNLAEYYERGEGFKIGDYAWGQKTTNVAKLYERAVGRMREAMCKLAFYYKYGKGGVPKDLNKTIELYQKAAELEDAEAMCGLACCYIRGEGVPQNLEIAKGLLQRAKDLGDRYASTFISRINIRESQIEMYPQIEINPFVRYDTPIRLDETLSTIGPVDLPEKRAKMAANLGCVEGYRNLSEFYVNEGNPQLSERWHARYLDEKEKWSEFHSKRSGLLHLIEDVEKLFLKREVKNENSYAMYELGRLYESGYWQYEGSDRYINVFKAFKLYEQAANRGNLDAMIKVGVCYRDGKGVCKDAAKAREWLEFSAKSGSVEGMHEYAVFLEEVDLNIEEAIKWYNEVAKVDENRRAEVIRRIGKCYKYAENLDLKQATECLQQAADLGDTEAMRQLGICYENGEGVDKNLSMAAKLYQLATDRNNAKAMVNLASCYENGHGVPQDLNIAIELLKRAVDLNDSDAMFKLASWYEQGKGGLPQDLVEVAYLLGQAAGNEHVEAMYKLGLMFMEGKGGVNKNLDLGIRWFKQAAKNEQVDESWVEQADQNKQVISKMHELGLMFKNGEGVVKDPLGLMFTNRERVNSEVFWFKQAAKRGNVASMVELGAYYMSVEGGNLNPRLGVKWLLKAAEKGDIASMIEVGVCYRDGKGIDKDAVEARKWLRFAAERNDVRGMYEFGVFLEEVMYDDHSAMEWYQKAADNGFVEAMGRLGACYKRDALAPKDLTKAVRWLQQAVNLEDAEAMRQLGICYENGEGVVKDLSRALELYQRAVAKNSAKAMVKLASWYEQGEAGLPQNLNEAFKLLKRALDLGDSDAMFKLASWYEQGKAGLPQDLREILHLLERASENGHVEANYKLGLMYMDGRRLPKDLRRGLMRLQKAADKGSVEAISYLYDYYENKTEDYAKFENLFSTKMYLEKGDEFYQLACKCEHDDENLEEAIRWYGKAEFQYSRAELFYERAFGTELQIPKKTMYTNIGYYRCMKILADNGIEEFDFFEDEV